MHSFSGGEPPHWFSVLLHVLMLLLALGAVGGLMLRKKRKARGSDLIVWIGTGVILSMVFNAIAFHSPETNRFIAGFHLFLWSVVLLGSGLNLYFLHRQRGGINVAVSIASILVLGMVVLMLLPSVPQAREAARRSQCKNNLKQLGLAMHSYYDKDSSFPLQAAGAPPHSWRVDLLPWIEQEALYQRYDQDTAWNEGANLPISKTFISSYSCPSMPNAANSDGMAFTSYALVIDPNGIYSPDAPPRKLTQVPGGISQTVLVAEACGQNLIWTDPDDIKTADVPLGVNLRGEKRGESKGVFSSYHSCGANIAFADGSVRFLSQNTSPEVLKSLINANDRFPDDF